MFIAGVSGITNAQFNNLRTIPREEQFSQAWITSDNQHSESFDTTFHYIPKQVEEFLESLTNGRLPLVKGEDDRRVVEPFTAIYQRRKEYRPVRFPIGFAAQEG